MLVNILNDAFVSKIASVSYEPRMVSYEPRMSLVCYGVVTLCPYREHRSNVGVE